MALRIQTNVAALNAHRNLAMSDAGMSKSLERLSSGFRVNRAADDAAGLAMSNKFVAQIRSMDVASRNTSQANSLLQIAEGGTDQISQILARLKELSTQAASANSQANLSDINTEATALKSEIDRIVNSTTFQGTKLIDGNFGDKSVSLTMSVTGAYNFNTNSIVAGTYSVVGDSVGITIKNTTTSVTQHLATANGAQTYNFNQFGISFSTTVGAIGSVLGLDVGSSIGGMTATVLTTGSTFQVGETNGTDYRISFKIDGADGTSLSVSGIDLSTATGAQSALDKIDTAIAALSTIRANIGAVMNRLDYTSANLAVAIENASSANSVVKDVDMAAEMTSFTKNQILVQAGTAMLAQANSSGQLVLSLFK
ncbi:MAG: flagellin [Bacteroidia bacterium]|nr:flagellin [Bacteroidia bacterium]